MDDQGGSAEMIDFRLLSYGGGTQSAALALMVAAGDLPRVDAVIFADTHGELPETYEFAEYVKERLARVEIPFVTVSAGSLEAALLSPVRTGPNPTPPSHVLNEDGSKGRVGQYRCSFDYKRRLITREVKHRMGPRGVWKRTTAEQWIGFSMEEHGRCKADTECRCTHPMKDHMRGCKKCECEKFDRWRINRFPLIEMQFRRQDTIKWFADNGHPEPPRSACYFCPNSSNVRWAKLKVEKPELFERACALDEHIRHGGAFNDRGNVALKGQLFLHASLVPLREADLRTDAEVARDAGQLSLFEDDLLTGDCASGVCFT